MPDWAKIILELRAVCGSCRQIARLIHYGNQDYLSKMTRNEIADPPWKVGNDLIDLYRKLVKEEIPMAGMMQQRALIK